MTPFPQRVRRLYEWAKKTSIFCFITKKIAKQYCIFFINNHAGSHRTSNMLDRLMQRMDMHLFSAQYFHGFLSSAELNIRAWALILNFAPLNPITIKNITEPRVHLNDLTTFGIMTTGWRTF